MPEELTTEKKQSIVQVALQNSQHGYYYDEKLLTQVDQDKQDFYQNALPNIPNTILDLIVCYLDGTEPERITLILDKFNSSWREELEKLEDDEKKANLLARLLLKEQSYEDAVANSSASPRIEGAGKDPDFLGLDTLLRNTFGENILQSCLISEIRYHPNQIYLRVNGGQYLLPSDEYLSLVETIPFISDFRFRAESLSNWNLDSSFTARFHALPIIIYSFVGQDLAEFDYLNTLAEESKMKAYKQGTVVHEIAHLLFDYQLSKNQRTEWVKTSNTIGDVTKYAKSYSDQATNHEENFCEAIRLFATTPEYLQNNFPQVYGYISNTLESLKSR